MPDFTIDAYQADFLPGMMEAYNRQAGAERHIAFLTPELFEKLVAAKSYFDPRGVFVARRDGRVVGWVHACRVGGTEAWHTTERAWPRIRMLVFGPEDLRVGRALVEEATRWLEGTGGSAGAEALHADHGYPFYRGLFMGGEPMNPTTLPHLHAALDSCGYKAALQSILFRAEMRSRPTLPVLASTLELRDDPVAYRHEMQRESWTGFEPREARIFEGQEQAGSIGYVVIPQLADRVGAPVMSIWSLGVADSYRRRGIGTALTAVAMQSAWDRGARSAILGTQAWNIAAHGTYQRTGFVPFGLMIGRVLEAEKSLSGAAAPPTENPP